MRRLRTFREHGVHVLGSFIFGLPTDRPDTFETTAALAEEAGVAVAQFVLLTPFPGTVDFQRWEKKMENDPTRIAGVPLTRYWLIPQSLRPKMYMSHPVMSGDEIRWRTQGVWDNFYRLPSIWKRSSFLKSLRSRLAFTLLSKLYRQMYANTRNRHRQRPGKPLGSVGAVAGETLPAIVSGCAHAGVTNTGGGVGEAGPVDPAFDRVRPVG